MVASNMKSQAGPLNERDGAKTTRKRLLTSMYPTMSLQASPSRESLRTDVTPKDSILLMGDHVILQVGLRVKHLATKLAFLILLIQMHIPLMSDKRALHQSPEPANTTCRHRNPMFLVQMKQIFFPNESQIAVATLLLDVDVHHVFC